MIFAAGLGTRLRPLTHEVPKALVDIGGIPILEHVARRLVAAGADRLIINTHPHPEQIRRFVRDQGGFGVEVVFSHEPDGPLDTAGGLRRARDHFRRTVPFFIHNCDVFSDIDLSALYADHGSGPDRMATLAVLRPSPERFLVFDDVGLCGYAPRGGAEPVFVRPCRGARHRRDFSGIHVAAPELLDTLTDDSPPSIIMHYLELSRSGVNVARHDQLAAEWRDIGTHEQLADVRRLYADQAATR